jgi:glutamate formiminotransferase / 5-formyltetrahydrofolate cyclo-ligase
MPDALPLLTVPNVSEGRDLAAIEAIAQAFTAGGAARLLDVHADADHHRAVFTLAGCPGSLADALVAGAAEAVRRIDIGDDGDRSGAHSPKGWVGQHPYVGAVDVAPVVYLDPTRRGEACAEALVAADRIGVELGVPVFLYGELADGRSRSQLRRGGAMSMYRRMLRGELRPDFGPDVPHPTAGVTLVAARGPLVAFNLELAPPATVEDARAIASLVREGGVEGIEGLRAIGVSLRGGVSAQVSMNVERPAETPLREVVEAVRRHAEVACAELVGLAPAVALEGFPEDLPMPGFDAARHVIENALSA